MFIVKRSGIKLVTIINYSWFDLFPNLNTVQNLPNFSTKLINLNTLNIPSIWDTEKSNDSPQRIIADGSFMLSSFVSDPTAM